MCEAKTHNETYFIFRGENIFFMCREKKTFSCVKLYFLREIKKKKCQDYGSPVGPESISFFLVLLLRSFNIFCFPCVKQTENSWKTFLTWKKEHQKNTKILPGPSGRSNNCFFHEWISFFSCVERKDILPDPSGLLYRTDIDCVCMWCFFRMFVYIFLFFSTKVFHTESDQCVLVSLCIQDACSKIWT